MARVNNDGLTGTVGNVIIYSMNGGKYARSKPGRRTKKRGQKEPVQVSLFRTISRSGTAMVKQMSGSFLFPFGRDVYNRLRGWMWNSYSDHHKDPVWALQTCIPFGNFNTAADLHNTLNLEFTVSDNGRQGITLNLAAFNPKKQVKAPPHTAELNLKFIALSANFDDAIPRPGYSMQVFSFAYTDRIVPKQDIMLNTGAKTGDIAMVVVAVEFRSPRQISYNKDLRWLPAGVVAMGRIKR